MCDLLIVKSNYQCGCKYLDTLFIIILPKYMVLVK